MKVSHDSVCIPRSGWEKGSVENAVGTIRRNLFVPVRMITGSISEYNRSVMMKDSFAFEAGKIHYRKGKAQSLIWQEEDETALHALPEKSFIVHRIESMSTTWTRYIQGKRFWLRRRLLLSVSTPEMEILSKHLTDCMEMIRRKCMT